MYVWVYELLQCSLPSREEMCVGGEQTESKMPNWPAVSTPIITQRAPVSGCRVQGAGLCRV